MDCYDIHYEMFRNGNKTWKNFFYEWENLMKAKLCSANGFCGWQHSAIWSMLVGFCDREIWKVLKWDLHFETNSEFDGFKIF